MIRLVLLVFLVGCHTCHAPEHVCPTPPEYEHPAYENTLEIYHDGAEKKLLRGDSCGYANCKTCYGDPFCKGVGKQADWKIKSDLEWKARQKAFKDND